MICTLVTIAGVAVGVVAGRASVSKSSRSILKTAIGGALAAGRVIQAVASEAREELSDIAAEARADLSKNVSTSEIRTTEAKANIAVTLEQAEAQVAAAKAEATKRELEKIADRSAAGVGA